MEIYEWIILIVTVLVSILLPHTSWKCDSLGKMVALIMILLSSAFVPKYGILVALLLMLSMSPCLGRIDIQQQIKIKLSLDPNSLLNPGKVYPILRKCAEEGRVHVHQGKTKFPDIPRF